MNFSCNCLWNLAPIENMMVKYINILVLTEVIHKQVSSELQLTMDLTWSIISLASVIIFLFCLTLGIFVNWGTWNVGPILQLFSLAQFFPILYMYQSGIWISRLTRDQTQDLHPSDTLRLLVPFSLHIKSPCDALQFPSVSSDDRKFSFKH